MASKKTIVAGVVILAVVFLLWWYVKQNSTTLLGDTGIEKTQQPPPPTATANVDDAVNALLLESSLDATAFSEESAESAVLQDDSQAISDFGQTYDEREF